MKITKLDARWEKIAAINFHIVTHAGEEWIVLNDLAKELGVGLDRLRRHTTAPSNIARGMRSTSFTLDDGKSLLAISRPSIAILANRLVPGTNNGLRKLAANFGQIAIGESPDMLVKKNMAVREALAAREKAAAAEKDRLKKLAAAKAAVLRKIDAFWEAGTPHGQPLTAAHIEWLWKTTTGLSHRTMLNVLRGTAQDSSSQAAYKLAGVKRRSLPGKAVPNSGRKAVLTADVIRQIIAAGEVGQDHKELARRFRTGVEVIQRILKGKYASKAMDEVRAEMARQNASLRAQRPCPD